MSWRAAVLQLLLAASALADGMIVVPRATPAEAFPLAVRYHRVQVEIRDAVARTTVDQEFFNPTGARLEGMYIFPLPTGAVISNFSMEIDGKAARAELLDAAKARGIYEGIVRSMRDPALLEYAGNGAFQVRIFPLEPRAGKRVRLSYSEALHRDGDFFAYTYSLNTEKFSSAPLEDVSIRADLRSSRGLKSIFCPTHDVEIRRTGDNTAVVGFEEKQTKPDADFTLYFSTDDGGVGLSVLAYRPPGEDGYFLLTATPAYDTSTTVLPKDITLVVDTSGSMAGRKMAQAKRAIRYCLDHLNSSDRFDVIRFSTDAEALFGELAPVSAANVARAQSFVDGMEAIGGTNADEALTLALRSNAAPADAGRPRVVIFLTDGKPTIGETDEDRLVQKARKPGVRVFTFGIGDDLDTHFLDKLTEVTRAARVYVGETEDIELPVSLFYEKIRSPVLVDLAIAFGDGVNASQLHPRDLPDLFRGSQLMLFGRYRGSGDSVTLRGTVNGRRVSIPYKASFPARSDANALIAPLWAAQRIGYLLDQIRLSGREEKELVGEVTALARRFGIITPYTSYLIMEDEKVHIGAANQTLNALPSATQLNARMKGDYDAMKQKAGAPSVRASKEVDALRNSVNSVQTKQGTSRMGDLNARTKNVQGRAVYQVGSNWVDSAAAEAKNQNVRRIRFASTDYFTFLQQEPQAAQFLSLGRNVRFVMNGQIYDVTD